MRGVPGAVIFGETGHRALFQLFDPLDFPLKTVADVNGESWILGVENIPLGATFEGVSVSFDEVLKSGDSSIELPYFGHMVGLSLLDRFEKCFSDTLQCIGVKIGAAVEDVGS